jgi:hypothetical protein
MGWLSNPYVKAGVGIGGSLLGNWLGGKAAQSAMQRTPEEQQALAGGQAAAGGLGRQGAGLTGMGLPYAGQSAGMLGQSGNYWQTLLGGNRAAMAQATAAPRGAITDQYRGAERSLERSGVRGGVADLARAELSRDRAGKIAGLTTGVQPMAAEQLASVGGQMGQLGTTLTGQGTAALIGGGNTWAQLLRAGAENRFAGQQAGAQTASQVGGGIWDLLSGGVGKGALGGSSSGSSYVGQDVASVANKSSGGHWYDFFKKWFGGGGGDAGGWSSNYENPRNPQGRLWDPWYGYLLGQTGAGGGTQGGGGHTPPR